MERRFYVPARFELYVGQETVAKKVQTQEAWTEIVDYHLELLRFSASDSMGLRMPTHFLLIRRNRDDEAYASCGFWLGSAYHDPDHSGTDEGDFIYQREENCCFNDIFQECGEEAVRSDCEICLVPAVAVVRMRRVALYGAMSQEINAFTETDDCQICVQSGELKRDKTLLAAQKPTFARLLRLHRQLSWICLMIGMRALILHRCILTPSYG